VTDAETVRIAARSSRMGFFIFAVPY